MDELRAAYRAAQRRLLLLDYDGTLVSYATLPEQAAPSPATTQLLKDIASDAKNTVVIMSGRPPEELDAWFGDIGISMAAEHGHFFKLPGGRWQRSTHPDAAWKQSVLPIMQQATQRATGSFIEQKHTSLVWHYRQAKAAEGIATELINRLAQLQGVHVTGGVKIVEARQPGMDKGKSAAKWLHAQAYDFILAAGDDVTDEDMFAAMPPQVFCVKIGPGKTKARQRLDSPQAFVALLTELTKN